MLRKFKITLSILMVLVFSNLSFASTLPLNTGFDYSNYATYPFGVNDDYWIRIASYPPMTPPVGPSWAVSPAGTWLGPLIGPPATTVSSTWINAFGNTNASASGVGYNNPAYAIYRKCFCLPPGFSQPRIQGSVRTDEAAQGWLNSMVYQFLPLAYANYNQPPHNFNYTNAMAFRTGKNCVYMLVDDTGGNTGFDMAAYVTGNSAIPPIIAKGPNMSFEPCGCGGQGLPTKALKTAETEDQEIIQQIVKIAEARRMEKSKTIPKN